jgi:nucleotide-binding universal stress UspA family protein
LAPPCDDDTSEVLLEVLQSLQPDLLVSTTHARSSLARIFAGSIAETLARNLCVPALILPAGHPGFVDADNGQIHLDTMLLPVGGDEDAQLGLNAALALCRLAGVEHNRLVLLHVVNGTPFPAPEVPIKVTVTRRVARGGVVPAVVACAREVDASLVVMPSHGHDSLGDVFRESQTERVLHASHRPLLWVPAGARLWQ